MIAHDHYDTFKMISLISLASIFLSAAATSYSLEREPGLAEQLVREVENLESYVQTQSARIQSLEAQMKAQEEEIRLLKGNGKADVVKSNPRPRMRAQDAPPPLNDKVNVVQHKMLHPRSTTRSMSFSTRCSTPAQRQVTRATDPHVAFSFYLDHEVDNVAINNIITFNKPLINDGAAYNNITGVFTCPVSGVYLFSYMVNTKVSANQLVVKLVVDGVNISDGTSDPMHPLQELQGGNTVLVRVSQGQAVWLAAYNTGNTLVDGRPDYRWTTFSGALLYTS